MVIDANHGVNAVDISDPSATELIFNYDYVVPEDFVLTEEYLYLADNDAGLIVLEW